MHITTIAYISGHVVVPGGPADWGAFGRVGPQALPAPHCLLHLCPHTSHEAQPHVCSPDSGIKPIVRFT